MAIIVRTTNPRTLLDAIYKGIDAKSVQSWAYDKDRDFFHSPEQWVNKGWLHPTIGDGELYFGLLGPQGTTMTKLVYAVYHGRFVEMLLNHFDTQLSEVRCTWNRLAPYDNFRTEG